MGMIGLCLHRKKGSEIKVLIALKNGKVWDMCSKVIYKKTVDSLFDNDYFKIDEKDIVVGDKWDSEKGISLKDSILREVLIEKSIEERLEVIETILGI